MGCATKVSGKGDRHSTVVFTPFFFFFLISGIPSKFNFNLFIAFVNLHQDSNGQECTVVLLDSEGIDSVRGEGLDDNQIFTLTVLLASVLIYNSAGVPTRHDLDGLEYPFFSKCIIIMICCCLKRVSLYDESTYGWITKKPKFSLRSSCPAWLWPFKLSCFERKRNGPNESFTLLPQKACYYKQRNVQSREWRISLT